MSLIAELRLDSPILRSALEAAPEMTVRFHEETVPEDRKTRLVFWTEGGDFEAFERGLADDWTVGEYRRLTALPDRWLYRVVLSEEGEAQMTYADSVDLDAVVLDAVGTLDGWVVRMQVADRDALASYLSVCREYDVDFRLERLYTPSGASPDDDEALTPAQRETLEAALEYGYFDVPREVSTAELGEMLDVSGQAVSERLRRGLGTAARIALDCDGQSDRHK